MACNQGLGVLVSVGSPVSSCRHRTVSSHHFPALAWTEYQAVIYLSHCEAFVDNTKVADLVLADDALICIFTYSNKSLHRIMED